jgi:branched-chain amino acid aminotransferase
MKAAAHAAGADFPIGLDERGFLAEGATENFGIVTRGGALRLPRPERILDGITVRRVRALAPAAIRDGTLAGVEQGDIARDELFEASEVLVFGTTPDVTSVVRIDGRPVGDGRPGPVRAALFRLLETDIRANAGLCVPVFTESPAAG